MTPKIYGDRELSYRHYASHGKTRKNWQCNRCTQTIFKGSENETSWNHDCTEMIRLCLNCVAELENPQPSAESDQNPAHQIDELQSKLADFYVLLVNTGENLKLELHNPTIAAGELQTTVERYCAIADGILSKSDNVGKLNQFLKDRK